MASSPSHGKAPGFVRADSLHPDQKQVVFYEPVCYIPPMSQDRLIKIQNKETKEIYFTRKNKKTVTRKLELKKYSKKLRKRVTFKEIKK